jgi:hypothetical protein
MMLTVSGAFDHLTRGSTIWIVCRPLLSVSRTHPKRGSEDFWIFISMLLAIQA